MPRIVLRVEGSLDPSEVRIVSFDAIATAVVLSSGITAAFTNAADPETTTLWSAPAAVASATTVEWPATGCKLTAGGSGGTFVLTVTAEK